MFMTLFYSYVGVAVTHVITFGCGILVGIWLISKLIERRQ